MTPCPPIATFVQSSGPALAHSWHARFVVSETIGRKRYLACLPMIFPASSEEAAYRAAEQWWRARAQLEASRAARITKAHAARRRAA